MAAVTEEGSLYRCVKWRWILFANLQQQQQQKRFFPFAICRVWFFPPKMDYEKYQVSVNETRFLADLTVAHIVCYSKMSSETKKKEA